MSAEATVFIVDDDPAVIALVTELAGAIGLKAQSWLSGDVFLAAYTPTAPGCLVLDVRMPGMSGLQLQKELNRQGATLPIILITGHADVRMAVEAMKAGAFEFFEKPFRTQDLCDKIQEAVKLDQEKWRRRRERAIAESRIGSLTPAERQVMELVVDGKTNKEIAAELDISLRAVEDRRARMMKRLQLKSRAELLSLLRQSALR
jgi:RNA polymerase sigma factor (sigma-70 family)